MAARFGRGVQRVEVGESGKGANHKDIVANVQVEICARVVFLATKTVDPGEVGRIAKARHKDIAAADAGDLIGERAEGLEEDFAFIFAGNIKSPA